MNCKIENEIRNRAKFITKDLTISDLPVHPVKLMYQIYGMVIDIKYDDLCGEDGYIFRTNGKYRIYIDINKHNRRSNYTEAHEVGHIVLGHFKYKESIRKQYYEYLDYQANLFASELLMPEHLIIEYLNLMPELVPDSLATRFHVSSKTMNIRMKDIEKKYWIPCSEKFSYGKNFTFYNREESLIKFINN